MSNRRFSSPLKCLGVVVLGVLLMMVCAALTLMLVQGADAQDGLSEEELALLADVQSSVAKFYQQQTYAVTGQQVSTTGVDMMGQKMEFTTTQNIAGQTILGKDGSLVASYQSLEQILDSGIMGMTSGQTFAYETILVDGQSYIKFTTSEGLGIVSDYYPQEWTAIDPEDTTSTLALFNMTPSFGSSYLPINGFDNPALMKSVTEVEGGEIDGQAMRIIEFELDTAAAQTSGLYGTNQVATSQALGAVMGGGAPTSPSVPSTDAITQEQLDQFMADTTLVQRVWIGVDDGLPHRVEIVIGLDTEMAMEQLGGMSLPIVMETTTTLDFSDFNAVFDIQAPEVAE